VPKARQTPLLLNPQDNLNNPTGSKKAYFMIRDKHEQAADSSVDRHRFDADPVPDQNFHVDADPDPHADPTPIFKHDEKSEFYFYSLSQHCQFTIIYLSHQGQVSKFSVLKFSGKVYKLLSWFGIYTDADPAK
jgi:hypothetical protein